MSMQPPFYDEPGPAPPAVCSRWMDGSPCGSAASHHVIWDTGGRDNGAVCLLHVAEIRRHWVYAGLHPYESACAASGCGAVWLRADDRCVVPDNSSPSACERRHMAEALNTVQKEGTTP